MPDVLEELRARLAKLEADRQRLPVATQALNALTTLQPPETRFQPQPTMQATPKAAQIDDYALSALKNVGRAVAEFPPVKAGLKLAGDVGRAVDWGFRGNVGSQDVNKGSVYIPASAQKIAALVEHGTPHIWAPEPGFPLGRFHSEKIGTGEGAQAYGHGGYWADQGTGVAKRYADRVESLPASEAEGRARAAMIQQNGDVGGAVRVLSQMQPMDDAAREAVDLIRKGYQLPTGRVYTADLPDESIAKMLDWDAPLSQQPHIIEALQRGRLGDTEGLFTHEGFKTYEGMTGQDAYRLLQETSSNAKAGSGAPGVSRFFRKSGIPGIKYFDGSSRAAGQGSRNYVVFEDTLPKILKVEK